MVVGIVLFIVVRYYDQVVILLLLVNSPGICFISGSRSASLFFLVSALGVADLLVLLVLLVALLLEEVEPTDLPLHSDWLILLNWGQMCEHPTKAILILELVEWVTVRETHTICNNILSAINE